MLPIPPSGSGRSLAPAERKILRYDCKLRICVERQSGLCGICGEPITGEIHLDHIIPESLGGETTLANLQAAHALCNLRKRLRSRLLPGYVHVNGAPSVR